MKRKWLVIIVLVICGVGVAYKFVPASMREGLGKQGQEDNTLSASLSGDAVIKTKKKDISITQHMFTDTGVEIKDLGALDDYGISQAVGFYATFGDYYDIKYKEPSMFSCEDVDTERLKQAMKGKCKWYEIKYKPFSFIFQASRTPLFFLENGKIYLKDNESQNDITTEIAQYNIGEDLNFNDIIENKEVWLDQKYCLKEHYFGNTSKIGPISWIPGLGEKLNKLYNEEKLKIYDIHEIVHGDCSNNNPGIVIYEEGSHKFYTVINSDPNIPMIYYDGIYSTPFSIDIE